MYLLGADPSFTRTGLALIDTTNGWSQTIAVRKGGSEQETLGNIYNATIALARYAHIAGVEAEIAVGRHARGTAQLGKAQGAVASALWNAGCPTVRIAVVQARSIYRLMPKLKLKHQYLQDSKLTDDEIDAIGMAIIAGLVIGAYEIEDARADATVKRIIKGQK